MLAVYTKLEKEGKIGRFDAAGRPRPFVEFPKQVRQPKFELVRRPPNPGETQGMFERVMVDPGVVVHSQREELAFLAENGAEVRGQDPVLDERDELRKEVKDLRAQLEQAIAALQAKAQGMDAQKVLGDPRESVGMPATTPLARTPPPKPSR